MPTIPHIISGFECRLFNASFRINRKWKTCKELTCNLIIIVRTQVLYRASTYSVNDYLRIWTTTHSMWPHQRLYIFTVRQGNRTKCIFLHTDVWQPRLIVRVTAKSSLYRIFRWWKTIANEPNQQKSWTLQSNFCILARIVMSYRYRYRFLRTLANWLMFNAHKSFYSTYYGI